MGTLVCLRQPPFLCRRVSPWIKRSLSPQQHTLIQTPGDLLYIQASRRIPEPHAGPKGFGGAARVLGGKIRRDDEVNESSGGHGDGDDEDEIPQVVFNRMIVRILFFVGTPMALGVGFLSLFTTLKEQHVWDVPLWLPFLTIVLGFGTSALGIAYGSLSTSWDPERKGSLLGWEQAQKNWPDLWKEEEERNR